MKRLIAAFAFVSLPLAAALVDAQRAGAPVVENMPEFQKAFSCKAEAPMVSRTVCRVW